MTEPPDFDRRPAPLPGQRTTWRCATTTARLTGIRRVAREPAV